MKKIFFLIAVPLVSQNLYSQEWKLSRSDISKNGTIYEEYKDSDIFNNDFKKKTESFYQAIIKKIEIPKDKNKKLNIFELYKLIIRSDLSYNGKLPESFLKGVEISSLNSEFLLSNAYKKDYRYLPDWTYLKTSYEVGTVGYGIAHWDGSLDINIKKNNDKSTTIIVNKSMRIDRSSDSFQTEEIEMEIKYWNEGQMYISITSSKSDEEKKCSTVNYRSKDLLCTNNRYLKADKILPLLNIVKNKDLDSIMNDWVYKISH